MASSGAIGGGALGGAGTGAAIGTAFGPGVGTAIGAAGGALIGGLSGMFSSNAEEKMRKEQLLMRAADQRAAPWLAKLGAKPDFMSYTPEKDHSTDVLAGGLSGFQALQNAQSAEQNNKLREMMMQKLMGQNPQAAQAQIGALNGMAGSGAGVNDAALMQLLSQQGMA